MRATALAFTLIASPIAAQGGPQPVLAVGETLEVETGADLNGDGLTDLAYVIRSEDRRELRVVTSYRSKTDFGENPVQVLALDPYPLGDAALTVRNKVLMLQELSGGTTAVFSTHRFRWDANLAAMRLIGLDATLYSRTFAHDGQKASWNLLTGTLLTHTMRLRGDDSDIAYDEVNKRRRKKSSPPLRLERSPSGDELLDWPGGQ